MKKLFIISIFLCIMFFPKNTFALDYQVNGTTYQVSDTETLRDYVYYTYVNGTDKGLFAVFYSSSDNSYYAVIPPSNNYTMINFFNYSRVRFIDSSQNGVSSQVLKFDSDFILISNEESTRYTPRNYNLSWSTAFYPNVYYEPGAPFTGIYKEGNYTFEDITSKYVVEESEEEKNMFDVVETFLIQFINILPFIIPFILVMNLICRMLFNERS